MRMHNWVQLVLNLANPWDCEIYMLLENLYKGAKKLVHKC